MEKNPVNPEVSKNGSKPFETDSEKIVRRHLENEGDEITDEDIRNVRVVTSDDAPAPIGAEAEARLKEDGYEEETDSDDGTAGIPDPGAKPKTPWDVLGE